MNKTTQEQMKEFWEWCGVEAKLYVHDTYGEFGGRVTGVRYPSIDLNNLFRYAVPRALEALQRLGATVPIIELFTRWYDKLCAGFSYGDGLFWAIQGVIKEVKK